MTKEQKIKLEDLAINHDYYCSESNFFDRQTGGSFDNWECFYSEYKDADPDYNLVFRWDIKKRPDKGDWGDDEQWECLGEYYMEVFIVAQRKGFFMPIFIDSVEEKNVPEILEFLGRYVDKIKSIWSPLEF